MVCPGLVVVSGEWYDLTKLYSQTSRHLERFALLWPFDLAAANALDANPGAPHGPVLLNLNGLEVGPEGTAADTSDLAADATQVLGLATAGIVVAQDRLLATDSTLH